MERVHFLIEKSKVRLTCLLNPEEGSLEIERSSGAGRATGGTLIKGEQSDSPVSYKSRGDTRLTLKLLFDVTLPGSTVHTRDVRNLTRPFWQLAEYKSGDGAQAKQELPRVRFLWGKGWDIPAVVESVAERYERFDEQGVPRRSWLTMRLLRVDDLPPDDKEGRATTYDPTIMPGAERLQAVDPTWEVNEVQGGSAAGATLAALAAQYYGDPALWRLIATANDIDDAAHIPAGAILRIPPLRVLDEFWAEQRQVQARWQRLRQFSQATARLLAGDDKP